MVNRSIVKAVHRAMKYYPVIAITGPRQSGKTTLIKNMFNDYRYVSLENPDNRDFAIRDPNGFLEMFNHKVIFDEIQRVPSLFSFIQTMVDDQNLMGNFILSGSQNFNLIKHLTQSLAGRVAIFKLLPFDFQELRQHSATLPSYNEMIVRGCYPALFSREIPSTTFYSNYIQTYVERDLTELLNLKDLLMFRTFLKLCASRVGQQLNMANISNEAGISVQTAKSWLSILESSFIVYRLSPFYNSFNKRLVKSAKLYFYDTGLVSYLLGIRSGDALQKSQFKGPLFENMVINEYIKQSYHNDLNHEFYYWRDSNGREVDLLVSNQTKYDVVEIKATQTIFSNLFDQLDYLKAIGGEVIDRRILVYGGAQSQSRTDYQVWAWDQLAIDF